MIDKGSIVQVRELFIAKNIKRTLNDVLNELPHLKKHQVSKALHYLFAKRYLSREQIKSPNKDILVYLYTYHGERLPHPNGNKSLVIINPIEYYANNAKQY